MDIDMILNNTPSIMPMNRKGSVTINTSMSTYVELMPGIYSVKVLALTHDTDEYGLLPVFIVELQDGTILSVHVSTVRLLKEYEEEEETARIIKIERPPVSPDIL